MMPSHHEIRWQSPSPPVFSRRTRSHGHQVRPCCPQWEVGMEPTIYKRGATGTHTGPASIITSRPSGSNLVQTRSQVSLGSSSAGPQPTPVPGHISPHGPSSPHPHLPWAHKMPPTWAHLLLKVTPHEQFPNSFYWLLFVIPEPPLIILKLFECNIFSKN